MSAADYSLCGYYPGLIGQIVALHAIYYHRHWGFDASFEIQVAAELAAFIARFEERQDGLWAVKSRRGLVGSVAIDGEAADAEGARLRWFIVAPPYQGRGVGKKLIGLALDFCRRAGYRQVFLWTFRGLETARSIYEKHGFTLACEHELSQWGRVIREQKFVLVLD